MPIPTAEILDKERQNNTHATASASSSAESNNGNNGLGSESSTADDSSRLSQLVEGDQALSREEADRLYEERMEEEYAKREGGA
ncbi:hypothetical protein N7533_005745 [Penicillium manginii]|jgi:hypothetical protein|uniref:uncharacterized protein n=1 Tax=Penicillium manginii TaxID=203109 RepID=UPI0025465956|nr:uncharacterized protein N7533_005745 [Penicillium manginii]KAJ5756202.1 hypothetical protein N7533_005745 [Penicillium manginii]